MKHLADKEAIACRYLQVTHWLANRYAKTDRHGRRWLDRVRNGKPTRYAMTEQAIKDRYFAAMRRAEK